MTPDELMKPRYKVIADWPNMPDSVKVGDIVNHNAVFRDNSLCSSFPHLFKKLEWWHERREEDLPKYIGVKNEHGVFIWIHPIVKWVETRLDEVGSCIISFPDLDGIYAEREYNPWSMSPATQSEYEKMKAK
jgi:hypothetical protein